MKSPNKDEWRVLEANSRLAKLTLFNELTAAGESPRKAAKRVGVSRPTLWRWQKRFEAEGFNGLLPDTDECGRKSVLEKLGLAPESETILKIQAINLDTESSTAACRLFANSDQCPEELAQVILDPTRCSKHALPPSLRKAVTVNKNLQDAHRGPRTLSLQGMWIPRKLDILPGDIFTADDTTPIWAWWVPWAQCKEYPFGVKLLQGQLLPVMDVASQCILCFVLIAREKASYRAADIWRLFGHTFETVGLPRLGWQLERGSWEANVIRGVEVEYQENEITYSRRIGGLRQLPTNITDWHREKFGDHFPFPKTLQTWTSYQAKSKSIEAAFDRMQTLEGTLWGSLGRDQMRRPFEKAKKIYEACKRGSADPRLHFLSQDEMVAKLRSILDYLADEPMEGEVFSGIPRMKFASAVSEHPLFVLPEDQKWVFRRDWKEVTITNGWARVRLTHEFSSERFSLFYQNPRVFAGIEGEKVAIYFDRENFEQPAQIVLARTGEYLCEAEYFERRGSFLDGDRTGHEVRKAWTHAVTSQYANIVKFSPSRQLPAEIAARREAESSIDSESAIPAFRKEVSVPVPTEGKDRSCVPTISPERLATLRANQAVQAQIARSLKAEYQQ
jgi:hypothetical protein